MRSDRSSRVEDMHSLVMKYSTRFPVRDSSTDVTTAASNLSSFHTILVVGTRGALGSNILAILLESAEVCRVYSLNRARADGRMAEEIQADEFSMQGVDASLALSPKLTLLEGDTAHPTLGLNTALFDRVCGLRRFNLCSLMTKFLGRSLPV